MISYSAKVINPAKKADYSLRKFRVSCRFTTVLNLQKSLSECYPTFISCDAVDIEVGYITPGHGARGKQRWICDDIDLTDMYKEYKGKKEIVVWFYSSNNSEGETSKGKKRTHSPGETESIKQPKFRSTAQIEKMEEVDEILKKLKEKHSGSYTEEKLRAWAHLIQMDKHGSYDLPPDMPYFKKGNKSTGTSSSASVSTIQPTPCLSPCKRLTMRTACIEQLDKWHALLEKGGITQRPTIQEKIMSDVLKM